MISLASSHAPLGGRTDRPLALDAAQRSDRERTVQIQLLRHFMRESRYRQIVIGAIKVAIVVICWSHVDLAPMLAWFGAGVLSIVLRMRIERRFDQPGAFDSVEARAAFVGAMKPIYALHATIWGSSVLLFANRLPALDQFGCGLLVASVAALALRGAATVPPLMRIYMDTLFVVVVSCLAATSFTTLPGELRATAVPDPEGFSRALLLAILVFHWWLLRSFGMHIHSNQRGQYELQYDLVQKEHEARNLADARIRFLAAAAHDLRQPTTALSIYADQLLACPEDHLALAPRIARASNAVHHLFNSLFDMATLLSGKVALHVEQVPLRHLLDDLRVQFEATARAKSIVLRVQCEDAIVQTDPVQLRRMVGNVICNAIKYSPRGTEIRVVALASATGVRIEVADQGFGISDADRGKVFDEFYRVARPEHPAEDGIGLGLSIVSRLAHLLDCRLELQSVVGKGTRVTFVLPGAGAELR